MKSNAVMKEAPETVVAVLPKGDTGLTPKEEELGVEVTEIEVRAQAVTINSDQDYEAAGEFGVMLKKKAAEVTEFFKPLKDSAYKAHKAICDREKEMLTPLRNAEKTLKKTMGDYAMEQECKRREAEEAARRAAEEESRRKLEEAALLEKAGDMYVAEEVSEQGYTDAEYEKMGTGGGAEDEVIDMTPISQEQRKALFRMVHERMGKETGNELIQAVLAEFNLESTNGMPISTYHKVMDRIMDIMKSCDDQGEAPNQGEDPQE